MRNARLQKIVIAVMVGGAIIFLLLSFVLHDVIYAMGLADLKNWLEADIDHVVLSVLAVFLVAFLTILAVIFFVGRSLTRPLDEICHGASEYARGNLSYQIKTESEDEDIQLLEKTFNYMSKMLYEDEENQKEFIANLSHEIRSPLTSIRGYAVALQDGTIPPQMRQHTLDIIAEESGRLVKLTDELLTLEQLSISSRILHMQNFPLQEKVRSAAVSFSSVCAEKELTVRFSMPVKTVWAYADPDQVGLVLHNLIDNACKFSRPCSDIDISVIEKKDRLYVSIKDYGCGISRNDLPRIWEHFYKTDHSRARNASSVGLGLSSVKEIISAHNQQVDVISTQGVGTELIFTLARGKDPKDQGAVKRKKTGKKKKKQAAKA